MLYIPTLNFCSICGVVLKCVQHLSSMSNTVFILMIASSMPTFNRFLVFFCIRNTRKHSLHNGIACWCGQTCQCMLCKFSTYMIANSLFKFLYLKPKLYYVLGNNATCEDTYFLSPRMKQNFAILFFAF